MYAEECLPNFMFGISTNFPIGLSILTLLIGIVYAYFLYNKEDKIDSLWIKRILFLFRFLVVSFLCFLLLSPLVKSFLKQKEKPILIIAQDASSSVKDYNIYENLSFLSEQTKEDFDVFHFHFDQSIKNLFAKLEALPPLPEDFEGFPPSRPVNSHKGTFGHLGIIAGSMGFHGAAVLAARAAQRAQPGLITLHTPKNVYCPVASQLQAQMVHQLQPISPKPVST